MKTPKWLNKKALLLLHEESIAEFGGARGLRGEGLLESALARPLNLHAYQPNSSLAELAAAYGYGIAKNHAFVDGNKRVAFLSLGMFLSLNGHRLVVGQAEAVETILALAAGELEEAELASWIAKHCKRAKRI